MRQSGATKAFEALVTESRTMIWSVCLRITGNTYDAEDALQDTLLAAWRGMPRSARVRLRDLDLPDRGQPRAGDRPLETDTETEVDEKFNPERDFAEKLAEADLVQRALKTMPADFRVALVLREPCDYT